MNTVPKLNFDTTNLSKPKTRKKSEFRKSEPVYVRKLVDEMGGNNAVGALLGVTGKPIADGIKANKIAYTLELAAKGVWESKNKPVTLPNDHLIVTISISRKRWDELKPWLQYAEAVYKVFK